MCDNTLTWDDSSYMLLGSESQKPSKAFCMVSRLSAVVLTAHLQWNPGQQKGHKRTIRVARQRGRTNKLTRPDVKPNLGTFRQQNCQGVKRPVFRYHKINITYSQESETRQLDQNNNNNNNNNNNKRPKGILPELGPLQHINCYSAKFFDIWKLVV